MKINNDNLLAAVALFEKDMGVVSGFDLPDGVLDLEGLGLSSDEIADEIKQFIVANIDSGHGSLATAVWALGKRHDENNVSLFNQVLKKVINRDGDTTYQTLVALEHIGVKLFDGASSIFETKLNNEIGKKYLGAK